MRSHLVPEFARCLEVEDIPLLSAVLLLPWAIAGVEAWAFRTAALLIVISAGIRFSTRGWRGLGLWRSSRWLLPALLLAMWAVFQLLPLPPPVVRLLSPRADEIYRQTFPGYPGQSSLDRMEGIETLALEHVPEVEGLSGPDWEVYPEPPEVAGAWSGWRSLSLMPSATVERLHWYVALLLAFLIVARRCTDKEVEVVYRNGLFALFIGLSLIGMLSAATSSGRIFWTRETMDASQPFGPYINPAHFAGVMEMAVPWLAGYAIWRLRARSTGAGGPILAAAGALTCLVAALATRSKAAPVIIVSALFVLAIVSVTGLARKAAVFVGFALVSVAGAFVLRGSGLGDRVREFLETTGGDLSNVDRLVAWKSALGMFGDFRWVGSGFGSFREVFPHYLPAGEYKRWVQLHNDYLEVLIEGGLVVGLLLAWLLVAYVVRLVRARVWIDSRRWNPEVVGIMLGLLSLSIHAAFDFNHQIPANALLFVTIAAMLSARCVERG